MKEFWKVGEIAERTGLTVRALHYYDEIGLCSPASRSPAGYRLYGAGDIIRLQQIVSLKRLGFPLDEVQQMLEGPNATPRQLMRFHIGRLEEGIQRQRALRGRLERIADRLDRAENVSAEEFLEIIREIEMMEKYYTPEQLRYLDQRKIELGDARIREMEAEWPELIAKVRAEMEKGTDPTDERVRALARQWMDFVGEMTGGNSGVLHSMNEMYQKEGPELSEKYGARVPDWEMIQYISRARDNGEE